MIDVLGLLAEKKATLQAWQEEIQALASRIEQAQVEIGSLEHVQRIHESRHPTGEQLWRMYWTFMVSPKTLYGRTPPRR